MSSDSGSNRNEVVDIMMEVLTQEYATEMYGKEREEIGEKRGKKIGKKIGEKIGRIEGAMENTVRMCKRFGATLDEAINILAEDFSFTAEKAAQYVRKLW